MLAQSTKTKEIVMRIFLPLFVASCLTSLNPAAAEGLEPVKLKDVKWTSCDPQNPKDPCKIAYFRGNPDKETNYSYFKVPRGYLFSAHWHTNDSHIVIVKGAFTVGGEHDTTGSTLQAGDYAFEPAKWIHWGKCAAEECIAYYQVDGPDSYIDVKDRRP
jgi:quercetin dioxygenase-like cupin family protein